MQTEFNPKRAWPITPRAAIVVALAFALLGILSYSLFATLDAVWVIPTETIPYPSAPWHVLLFQGVLLILQVFCGIAVAILVVYAVKVFSIFRRRSMASRMHRG